MANTSSAKKAVRTHAKRTARNKSVRTGMKTAIKKVVNADAGNVQDAFRQASKALDQAASKGVIHKNKAARKKSRLARAANKVAAAH